VCLFVSSFWYGGREVKAFLVGCSNNFKIVSRFSCAHFIQSTVGVPHFGVGDMKSLANGLVIIGTTKKVRWDDPLLILLFYVHIRMEAVHPPLGRVLVGFSSYETRMLRGS
jgi:hypothetical protein